MNGLRRSGRFVALLGAVAFGMAGCGVADPAPRGVLGPEEAAPAVPAEDEAEWTPAAATEAEPEAEAEAAADAPELEDAVEATATATAAAAPERLRCGESEIAVAADARGARLTVGTVDVDLVAVDHAGGRRYELPGDPETFFTMAPGAPVVSLAGERLPPCEVIE